MREMRLHTDAHDLARGSPPPLPANMSALARTPASALRAPRLAGALRGGKRCAAIETSAPRFAFPTAPGSVSFLLRPEATLDASTGARSARVVIARWESHDARERDRDASLSPRLRAPLRRLAPVAQRATGRIYTRRGSTRFQCSLVPSRASSRAEGIFLEPYCTVFFSDSDRVDAP